LYMQRLTNTHSKTVYHNFSKVVQSEDMLEMNETAYAVADSRHCNGFEL
jgi:hypothetical protein